MSYISRAGTLIWHWIYWCAAMLFRAIVFPLVLFGLALYLLPDLFPRRGSRRLTAQPQNLRKLQRPLRDGSDIFVLNPDGTKVAVEPLEASNQARAWLDVVSGAMVYEKTKL